MRVSVSPHYNDWRWTEDEESIPPPPKVPTNLSSRNESPPPPLVGVKDDAAKMPWHYMDGLWGTLGEVVRVLEFGAKKYKENRNWQRVENGKDRYKDAAMRHQLAFGDGERLDPETKINHLAHAICSLLFALWFDNKEHAK